MQTSEIKVKGDIFTAIVTGTLDELNTLREISPVLKVEIKQGQTRDGRSGEVSPALLDKLGLG